MSGHKAVSHTPRHSPSTLPVKGEVAQIKKKILRWGRANYKEFPWRKPTEPWHALIAEILLQRTRAPNVLPIYHDFLLRYKSLRRLARASTEQVEQIIYPLGLRWRAPLLMQLGKELARRNGQIPTTIQGLRSLPGVGAYVAAAWLSFHGNQRAVIIDSNVVRWLCRLVGADYDGETRREKWLVELADSFTPRRNFREYNYAILDFTMEICTIRPHCEICPLGASLCVYGRTVLATMSSGRRKVKSR